MYNTVSQNYRSAWKVLRAAFWPLIGISLLAELISMLVGGACVAVPIIAAPIVVALSAALSAIYLKSARRLPFETADLFSAFSSWNTATHVIGGMLWRMLWVFIWGLIPIAGPVIAVIKGYEYAFTPFILMTRPEISATEALKESKKLTFGLKGRMFLAEFIIGIILSAIFIISIVFALIPIIGSLFLLLILALIIVTAAVLPVFSGLVAAFFYENAVNPAAAQAEAQAQAQARAQYYSSRYQQYYQNPQQGQYYQGYQQQWQQPGQPGPIPPTQGGTQVPPTQGGEPIPPTQTAPVQPEPQTVYTAPTPQTVSETVADVPDPYASGQTVMLNGAPPIPPAPPASDASDNAPQGDIPPAPQEPTAEE